MPEMNSLMLYSIRVLVFDICSYCATIFLSTHFQGVVSVKKKLRGDRERDRDHVMLATFHVRQRGLASAEEIDELLDSGLFTTGEIIRSVNARR